MLKNLTDSSRLVTVALVWWVMLACPMAAAIATPSAWRLQSVQQPAGSSSSGLTTVSCTSPTVCIAVGSFERKGQDFMLVERWNGTRWAMQRAPNPAGARGSDLSGVSCATSRACTAVGSYYYKISGRVFPLITRWNGRRWSVQQAPRPAQTNDTYLTDVACSSAATCTAVGSYTWTITEQGEQVEMQSVVAEGWNGRRWSIQATPVRDGTGFRAISCSSASACLAVGDKGDDCELLAERWNGVRWSILSGPSCSLFYSDYPSNEMHLNGVSCASASSCIATGYYTVEDFGRVSAAVRWNGRRWSAAGGVSDFKRPGTNYQSWDNAVSCKVATACRAVGGTADNGAFALIEGFGTTPRSSQPAIPDVDLTGVSCTSETMCVAVGASRHRAASLVLGPFSGRG